MTDIIKCPRCKSSEISIFPNQNYQYGCFSCRWSWHEKDIPLETKKLLNIGYEEAISDILHLIAQKKFIKGFGIKYLKIKLKEMFDAGYKKIY